MVHWLIPEDIHTILSMAFWNSEGKRSPLNWKSKGMVLGGGRDTYDWNSKGSERFLDLKRSGISTGDRQECIPLKCLVHGLHQFANKALIDDTAGEG